MLPDYGERCRVCGHVCEGFEIKGGVCDVCFEALDDDKMACPICGQEHYSDDMPHGVCPDCLNETAWQFDTVKEIIGDEKENVQLSALVVSMLDPDEIEEICEREIRKCVEAGTVDLSPVIEADEGWFCERFIEHDRKEVER